MTTGTGLSPVAATLRAIPALLGDLVAQTGGLRARPDGRASSPTEAPLPFNATTFDDASALYALLASHTHLRVPAWRNTAGEAIGLPAGTTPRAARDLARRIVDELLTRCDDVDLELLAAAVRPIAARHPHRDRPTTSTTAVCPDCHGALLVSPPRHHGDAQRTACKACGLQLDEAEYARTEHRYAGLLASEKAAARAAKTRARLTRKYATA